MRAAITPCGPRLPLLSPNNVTTLSTTVRPPQRCLRSLAVSRPDEEDVESRQNVGVMGQAVLGAVKSKAQKQHSSSAGVRVKPTSTNKKEQGQQQKTTEQGSNLGGRQRQLSGSDVLWALGRASVEKAKQLQKKKKKKKRDRNRQEEDTKAVDVDEDDYHSVRPLCIKSEWYAKLVQLEKRLQELMLMDV